MLRNRLYYQLKPLIPRGLRFFLRRAHARRVLRDSADVWPVLPSAARPPNGWHGWPHQKQFALVLTHDVECQHGVDQVRQLAELELSLGFRSSFNFIPEGKYRVPDELRRWLVDRGFEVGVHDHRHDGRLYASRQSFRDSARIINQHLRAWNAVGFRSGFMLHNLDWIHDLDIAYDASTFDTDPFEPQPDGVGTIFPFWVHAPRSGAGARSSELGARAEVAGRHTESPAQGAERMARSAESPAQGAERMAQGGPDSGLRTPDSEGGRGYVELPYTLVQDSTLFLLLSASSTEIWQKKLGWIAAHGGMALVNIHPDYIDFGSRPASHSAYPVCLIREFLQHVKNQHAQDAWFALPKEVANYCVKSSPRVVL